MDHHHRHHDVIVVGARAAGAATALLLARRGVDVLAVDRTRYGSDTLSTHVLLRGAVLQLARWGLLADVVAAGTPPVRRTTFRYGGQVVPVAVRAAHGVDALYAPRRTLLDRILIDAAVRAGATVRFGVTATGVRRDASGRVAGVALRDADGRRIERRARYVIGADGLRSMVATSVGAPLERRGRSASSTVYGYWSGVDTDGFEWNFRPEAVSGAIPTNGGETCIFVSAPPRRVGPGGLDTLTHIVRRSSPELAARLDTAPAPSGVRTFVGQRGHLRRPWGAGWALVGDAGYFKDPLSTHGLTDALRDAEFLATAVLDALEGVDERDALAGYHR